MLFKKCAQDCKINNNQKFETELNVCFLRNSSSREKKRIIGMLFHVTFKAMKGVFALEMSKYEILRHTDEVLGV